MLNKYQSGKINARERMHMGGIQNWDGSRIQENRRINLPKEEEHLVPWEELQVSLGGWKHDGSRSKDQCVQVLSNSNSNAFPLQVFPDSFTLDNPRSVHSLWIS
jgi:hypothetical protein